MPKRYAICVGLTHVDPSSYNGWDGDCPGCDLDAARFGKLCHDRGFDGICVLVNAMARSDLVEQVFIETCDQLDSRDLLVLYNSGHGGQQPDGDGDELDGKDETLCWWDGELVDDQIAAYLSLVPLSARILFVSDTCNSGTNYRSRPAILPKTGPKLNTPLLHFGGCSDGRSSYGDETGGAFTNALLDACSDARKPLTYAEWFERAVKRMPRYQRPVMATWGPGGFEELEMLT